MADKPTVYANREEAGQRLAETLWRYAERDPLVFGLVRGGIAVAAPVARALKAPLYPLIVRKIGHPMQPELAVGAIGPGGEVRLDFKAMSLTHPDQRRLQEVIDREIEEWRRRQVYLDASGLPELKGRTVLVIDDGLATGSSASVAGESLATLGAGYLVLAIPVCPPEARKRMQAVYNEVVCLQEISDFRSVGQWFEDFRQLDDRDVLNLLAATHSQTSKT